VWSWGGQEGWGLLNNCYSTLLASRPHKAHKAENDKSEMTFFIRTFSLPPRSSSQDYEADKMLSPAACLKQRSGLLSASPGFRDSRREWHR
jgi:hypothetical protein